MVVEPRPTRTSSPRTSRAGAHERGGAASLPDAPPGALTLCCLPHAGGSAASFVGFAAALEGRLDVAAVQYPGRQDRLGEPVVEDLPTLAQRVASIVADDHDGPFALLGHSMGAVVGFEVARRLHAEGVRGPRLLAVSGRAPSVGRDETTHLLDDDELLALTARLSGDELPAVTDPELIELILPSLRGDHRAVATHPPLRAVIEVPILAVGATGDPLASPKEIAAWADHTSAGTDVRIVDGGHFFLYDQAPALADVLASAPPLPARHPARGSALRHRR